MRVLLISRCPPYPLHLGDRLIIYHLARQLSAMGVEIDLLAFAELASDWSPSEQRQYDSYFHDVVLFSAQHRPTPELLRRALIPVARYPEQAEHAFAPEMWREIERRVAKYDYDVVHLFGGIHVYEFWKALGDLPTIITPYESYTLYTQRQLKRGASNWREAITQRLQTIAARQFERWMFSPYAVTTVVSDVDRAVLLAINPDLRVETIPNGVDHNHFRQIKPVERNPYQILFVGNYEYAPNRDAALWLAQDIYPLVRQTISDAQLWLVGNAPPPEMQALASDTIHVTGRVPDVRPYLHEAGVFVCPLRLGAGIKNKVLEALAAGCPVVATPLSVEGIHVSDGESVLLGDNAAALATQTINLMQNHNLAAMISANGKQIVLNQYSWGEVANRYFGLYQELVKQLGLPAHRAL